MIHVFHDFVDPAPYLSAKKVYRDLPEDNVWHNRVAEVDESVGLPLLKEIHGLINSTVDDEVWADTFNYAFWRKGDYQSPHADSQTNDGFPGPYFWRTVGCVLYLNDEYAGGEIYFPQHNIELRPTPGTIVWFPGTSDFLHGVKPIQSGERITIASFWGEAPPSKHPFYELP